MIYYQENITTKVNKTNQLSNTDPQQRRHFLMDRWQHIKKIFILGFENRSSTICNHTYEQNSVKW